MNPLVVIFQIFAVASAVGLIGWSVVMSIRTRQAHPVLLLSLSAVSIVWLEAPYDWAIYVQFHPDFARAPAWGPLGAAWQGLPAMMPAGYVMYYIFMAAAAARIADVLVRRRGWRRPQALLVTGLLIGFVVQVLFDAFATYAGLWRFGRAVPGLVMYPGSFHQFPLYDGLAIAITIMVFTYLLGSSNHGPIERLTSRRARSDPRKMLLSLAAYVVVAHAVYLSVLTPQLITKVTGLDTTSVVGDVFPGVPNQPL